MDHVAADGIDTFVGERGGKVSGGQAQRIAIARAIAKNAPVILLDEATSALDDGTSSAVLAALDNLTRSRTVVNVSHRHETLSGCSHAYTGWMAGGFMNCETGGVYDARIEETIRYNRHVQALCHPDPLLRLPFDPFITSHALFPEACL